MPNLNPGAYFPEDCKITILPKGGTSRTITTRVTNFTDGGGGRDTDSVAHFGGAFVTIRKPREEFEVGFDVTLNDTYWAELMGGTKTTAGSPAGVGSHLGSAIRIQSQGSQVPCKIKLEWFDPEEAQRVGSTPGSNFGAGYKILYYNAYGVEYTKENAADDMLKGTVSFNLSAANSLGSGQKIEIELQNFADNIGSASYVQWETDANTLMGY